MGSRELRLTVFSYFFFLSFFFKEKEIIRHRRNMPKLMAQWAMALCLSVITVWAKPSRLHAKTDLRRMDEDNTCGNCGTFFTFFTCGTYGDDYACDKSSKRNWGCTRRLMYSKCWRDTDEKDDAAYKEKNLSRPSWCYILDTYRPSYIPVDTFLPKTVECWRPRGIIPTGPERENFFLCDVRRAWKLPCDVDGIAD